MIPLGRTIHLDFTVSNPTSGEADTADAITIRVFEDANDTAILTPTATERSGHTGNYRVPLAITAANGFEAGKSYNVVADVTIDSVSSKSVLATFVVDTLLQAAVVTDGSNTATTFETDLASSTDDAHNNSLLCFIDGGCAGQVRKITDYVGSTKFVTVNAAFTGTPAGGDKFIIINA